MKIFLRSITVSIALLLICGLIYPLGITGIGQLIFKHQANGSIAMYNGKPVGSELLGQAFSDNRYFHGRVSSVNYNTYKVEDTKPDKEGKVSYTGVSSGSSNLASSNPVLADRVKKDIDEFLKANPDVKKQDIPTDLLTSSASGVDTHISLKAARIQIPAISKATGISIPKLQSIVEKHTEGRTFRIFGEPRVNILKANLEILSILK